MNAFLRDKRGNFSLITGLMTLPLMASVAMVVDYTHISQAKSHAQNAIDAAALAGMQADGSMNQTLAQNVFEANLRASDALSATALAFEQDGDSWKVSTTATASHILGGAVGLEETSWNMSAQVINNDIIGEAGVEKPDLGCLSTLSDGSQSFTQNTGAHMYADHCTVNIGTVLEPNNGKTGFNSAFHLDVAKFCVAGKLNYDNRTDKSVLVETSCATPGDFYADHVRYMMRSDEYTDVADGACLMSGTVSYGNNDAPKWTKAMEDAKEPGWEVADPNEKLIVMEPGRYCGNINFNSGSYEIFLKPGLYVIEGDWNIAGMDIHADNVSLFFGPDGRVWSDPNTGFMLNAPTEGPLKGFAMWESPDVSSYKDWTFESNRKYGYFDGIIYLPQRRLTLNSSAKATYSSTIMVDEMIVDSGTHLTFAKIREEHFPESEYFNPPTIREEGSAVVGHYPRLMK